MNSPENPCHPGGRRVEPLVAREMASAMGLNFCPTCHRAIGVRHPRRRFITETQAR